MPNAGQDTAEMSVQIVLISLGALVPVAGMILYAVFSTPKPQDRRWDADAPHDGRRFD
jgi:hypothetical protein